MKHVEPRPYADSEAAARQLVQLAASIEPVQDGRIHIEKINAPFLFTLKGHAIEGDAGGAEVTDQANKMANSIDTNKRLRKTYNPVYAASVRRFDEARAKGAKVLKVTSNLETVSPPVLMKLFKRPF